MQRWACCNNRDNTTKSVAAGHWKLKKGVIVVLQMYQCNCCHLFVPKCVLFYFFNYQKITVLLFAGGARSAAAKVCPLRACQLAAVALWHATYRCPHKQRGHLLLSVACCMPPKNAPASICRRRQHTDWQLRMRFSCKSLRHLEGHNHAASWWSKLVWHAIVLNKRPPSAIS